MIGLFVAIFLGTVGVVQGYGNEAEKIMQELQKQVLAPIATSCVEFKIFDGGDLKRTLMFRRGYFYGSNGTGMKEKIFIDFVYPQELSKTKYFLVEDETGLREEELVWTKSQRRTRRIFNADQSWMQSSDYYYYDLLDHIGEGWRYSLVKKDGKVFTIEAKPRGKPKVYGRLTIRAEEITPDIFVYNEIVFYNKEGDLLKRERYFDFKHVWDMYYRPNRMIMESLEPNRNTKTEIRFRRWEIRPIKNEDFFIFQGSYLNRGNDFPSECHKNDFD